jgi:hypothetical protein
MWTAWRWAISFPLPLSACDQRGFPNSLYLSLGEWPRLPFTARDILTRPTSDCFAIDFPDVPIARAKPFRFFTFSRGSRQTVLHCAHRATIALSWGLCEQEGWLPAPSHFFILIPSSHLYRIAQLFGQLASAVSAPPCGFPPTRTFDGLKPAGTV